MKYIIIMMLMLMAYSCGTKQKLKQHSKQSAESKQSQQTQAQLRYSHTLLNQESDSINEKQWFKIYPRGEVQLHNGNFIGQVDSLLWYTSKLRLQKQLQAQQHDTIVKQNQQTITSKLTKSEDRIIDKQKHWLSWWPFLLLLLTSLIIYLAVKKMKPLFN